MKRVLKIIALGSLATLAIAAIAGSVYEYSARQLAREEFLPTGKLVDIGGRRIHIDCRGSGSPTVVFESGASAGGALDWAGIHDQVAATTRACAYSRAGILWSDPPEHQSGHRVAVDLHTVLEKAGERAPLVLVGHSLGGVYALIYTKFYGTDVAGIVFVDPSHPDQIKRAIQTVGRSPTPPPLMGTAFRLGAHFGIVRLTRPKIPATDPFANRAIAAYWPVAVPAMTHEMDALDDILAEAGTSRDLASRPVIVLSADRPLSEQQIQAVPISKEQLLAFKDLMKQTHKEMAGWSTNGEYWNVPNAYHYIQRSNPEVVIKAIDAVVTRVRTGEQAGQINQTSTTTSRGNQ